MGRTRDREKARQSQTPEQWGHPHLMATSQLSQHAKRGFGARPEKGKWPSHQGLASTSILFPPWREQRPKNASKEGKKNKIKKEASSMDEIYNAGATGKFFCHFLETWFKVCSLLLLLA